MAVGEQLYDLIGTTMIDGREFAIYVPLDASEEEKKRVVQKMVEGRLKIDDRHIGEIPGSKSRQAGKRVSTDQILRFLAGETFTGRRVVDLPMVRRAHSE